MSLGAVPQIITAPGAGLDDLARLTALLDRAEPRVRRRFLELVNGARAVSSLENIADLIDQGRIDDALRVSEGVAPGLATQLEQVYTAAGISSAAAISRGVDDLFDFNAINARSVGVLNRERLRLVAEFSAGQRQASGILLRDAFERGLAPIEQARILRGSIGLTARQAQSVTNFRALLQSGQARQLREALGRQLRDRRFDSSIRAAARGERVLSGAQIDRMVERYNDRFIQFRARTITRTETVAAVGAGDLEAFEQSIESGLVQPQEVISTWRTAGDERVRPSHNAMDGQEQPFGQPFTSGDGNSLRFPGDPMGPPSDTINCRCVVARRLRSANRARLQTEDRLAAG